VACAGEGVFSHVSRFRRGGSRNCGKMQWQFVFFLGNGIAFMRV